MNDQLRRIILFVLPLTLTAAVSGPRLVDAVKDQNSALIQTLLQSHAEVNSAQEERVIPIARSVCSFVGRLLAGALSVRKRTAYPGNA